MTQWVADYQATVTCYQELLYEVLYVIVMCSACQASEKLNFCQRWMLASGSPSNRPANLLLVRDTTRFITVLYLPDTVGATWLPWHELPALVGYTSVAHSHWQYRLFNSRSSAQRLSSSARQT
jgi:hypothetical protein